MVKPNLVGHRFNKFTVIEEAGRRKHGHALWVCKCDCGNTKVLSTSDLNFGATVSCGCYRRSIAGKNWLRHGLRATPIGNIFNNMIARCYKVANKQYHNYGGRGIVVCKGLQDSPLGLVTVIGQPPEGLVMDRINNNGNYSCGQCAECQTKSWPLNLHWVTPKISARNKRNNRLLAIEGQIKTIAEWAEIMGLKYQTLHQRLKRGRWIPKLEVQNRG